MSVGADRNDLASDGMPLGAQNGESRSWGNKSPYRTAVSWIGTKLLVGQ